MGEDYGRVGVNVAESWGDYKVFNFLTLGFGFPLQRLECDSCKLSNIEYAYYYIISKLFEAGLLPEGFKLLCCDCFYVQEKLGTTKCAVCGKLLDLRKYNTHITIFCGDCGITHYKMKFGKVF